MVILRAIINLDYYTFADDFADDLSEDIDNDHRSAEEVSLAAIATTNKKAPARTGPTPIKPTKAATKKDKAAKEKEATATAVAA